MIKGRWGTSQRIQIPAGGVMLGGLASWMALLSSIVCLCSASCFVMMVTIIFLTLRISLNLEGTWQL